MSPVPLLATCGMDGDAMSCECAAGKVSMEVIHYMQKRADELSAICGGRPYSPLPAEERYYRNAGASTAIHNLANEIGSFIINPLAYGAALCSCVDTFIDQHSVTCDCCDHVMIDVTAARAGGEQHCVAGDPEGDGMGCAHSWRETVVTLEAEGDQLRAKVEALEAALRSQDVQVKALRAERDRRLAREQVREAAHRLFMADLEGCDDQRAGLRATLNAAITKMNAASRA